jgi:hypothetical protein
MFLFAYLQRTNNPQPAQPQRTRPCSCNDLGTASSSLTAGDVALIAAAAVTSPLWMWFPIGAAVANVFCRPPPKDVSPVLLGYVHKLHRERCFATPFNKYFQDKLEDIQRDMRGYNHKAYNIALCGEARVGKSSLCNALLGVRDCDRGDYWAGQGHACCAVCMVCGDCRACTCTLAYSSCIWHLHMYPCMAMEAHQQRDPASHTGLVVLG